MTVAGTIEVELRGRNVGLTELLSRVQAESQRSGDAALRLAQSYARLASAQGQPAAGARLLASALQSTVGASDRAAAAVQTQISTLQRGSPLAAQFGDAMKSSLLGIVGPAALATTALAALKGGFDLAEEGFKLKASLDTTNASIALQLKGVRDSGQVFAEATKFADKYKLTQQETAAAIQASIPILRTSNASLTDVESTLLRLQAKKPEKSIADAARALDELKAGQVISIVDQFNVSREAANKMKNEIASGADAVQVLGKYLTDAGIGMSALENRTKGATGKMHELEVESEKFKLALGGEAGGPGLAILEARIKLLTGGTRILSGDWKGFGSSITASIAEGNSGLLSFLNVLKPVAQLTQDFVAKNELPAIMQQVAATSPGAAAGVANLQLAYQLGGISASAFRDALIGLQAEQQAAAPATDANTNAINLQSPAMIAASNATALHRAALADDRQEMAQAAIEAGALSQVTQTAAEQSLVDAQNKGEQAAKTQLLTAQTTAAANAFLALYPGITASGVASLVAAGKIDPLLAQLIQATIRAREARDALADFNAQAGIHTPAARAANFAERHGGEAGDAITPAARSRAAEQQQIDAQIAANKKKADIDAAQNERTLAVGTNAQKIALLEREKSVAVARYGAESAEAIRAQTQIDQAIERGTKKAKGAGGVKLSDQQKLNNTLLADQEQYQNKSEDAGTAHTKKLLDIERDYAQKSLEQQRANEVSKRASRFSFYSSLSSASKALGGQEAAQYSQAYEEAFAESQKLAAEGHKKEASDLLALRQKQIQDDIEAAKAVAEAKKNNDGAEVERLQALEALRKDAQREELEQLKAAGDPNVNARQAQIDEEQAHFQEAQDKIGLAADRSAERKVTAAERGGKAVDAEKLKLDELAKAYDKVAPARGVAPVAGPAAGVPPPTAAAAAASTGPLDLGALIAKLDEVKAAIVGAEQDTTRAVRTLGATGNIAG